MFPIIRRFLYIVILIVAPLKAAQATPTIWLFSPLNYQTFQRYEEQADVTISGQVNNFSAPVDVEYRIDGGDWLPLVSAVSFRYDAVITLPQGQYSIEVRAGTATRLVEYVGVGDIFVIAGQSNASGRGTAKQVYSHPTLKASLNRNSYVWSELIDWTDNPTGALDPVANDGVTTSAYGSVWPPLATLIMADQNVPVAFIPVPLGGTSISQWLPDTENRYNTATLYGAMLRRIRWAAPDGVKAVLWWQGETDAGNTYIMPAETYADYLGVLAQHIYTDFGVPTFAAKIFQLTGLPAIRTWAIHKGVDLAIEANPDILFLGADLSDMLPDDTAAVHITTNAKLQEAALRWWNALEATVYAG